MEGRVFFSFLPGEGGKLFATRGRKTRHIEFIGDSFTCGYGTDGSHRDESFSVETENADKTYACILSRYFDADYTLLAHSGRGAVRNYGDAVRVSHYTMKDAVKFVLDTDTSQRYIASHKPDLVVVFLGTNDFSTQPEPKRAEFKKGYGQLLTWLREQYGEVPILCVIPAVGERVEGYIRELVAERQDNRLVHTASLRNVINDTTDLGAGWQSRLFGASKDGHVFTSVCINAYGLAVNRTACKMMEQALNKTFLTLRARQRALFVGCVRTFITSTRSAEKFNIHTIL